MIIAISGIHSTKCQLITKQPSILYDIASYMSDYELQIWLNGKFDALFVRSFANDLLNVKLENF